MKSARQWPMCRESSSSTEQPMAHLISAMLSGVQSQVAVKVFGDDLDVLRAKAQQIEVAMKGVPGITDLVVRASNHDSPVAD